ncbi:MAG: hypothetical protein ABI430_04435 [Candidatus Taylorbacteria bacterium]
MSTIQAGVLNLYKRHGETPRETIERFKSRHPEYADTKMTYAGRLDPMAEGVLLVVCGKEIENKEKYLDLDKEYIFEAVFGIQTDTYDILGVPSWKLAIDDWELKSKNFHGEKLIINEIDKMKGKRMQLYPPYSSKTVLGRKLFNWAKEGKLNEIDIPEIEIEIYNLELTGLRSIHKKEFEEFVNESISKVKGDFRQDEIAESWKTFFENCKRSEFVVFTFRTVCSRGTYVRSIVHELGIKLQIGAVTLHIKRTRVGNHVIHSSLT